MERVQPKAIIQKLAEMHELTHPTGKINMMAFARHVQIPEGTIKRIARGTTKRISDRVAEQLMNAFSINEGQAKGFALLAGEYADHELPSLNRRDREFLENYRKLSSTDREEIGAFVALKAQGLSMKEIARRLLEK